MVKPVFPQTQQSFPRPVLTLTFFTLGVLVQIFSIANTRSIILCWPQLLHRKLEIFNRAANVRRGRHKRFPHITFYSICFSISRKKWRIRNINNFTRRVLHVRRAGETRFPHINKTRELEVEKPFLEGARDLPGNHTVKPVFPPTQWRFPTRLFKLGSQTSPLRRFSFAGLPRTGWCSI